MSVTPPSPSLPPAAKRVPFIRSHHGDEVVDDYAWLRDGEDPDTLTYLAAENAFTESALAHLAPLREKIFNEIKDRTQETDLSVPVRKGDWWYYSRTVEGQQYPIHCRRVAAQGETTPPQTDGSALLDEQVLLDENEVAGESEFFSLGAFDLSPDGRRLAFSTDFAGDERFTLRVKDLVTGEVLADEIPNTFYGTAWSLDGSTLFYVTVDEAWRPYRVWRHRLGHAEDALVYEESDERFWVSLGLTRSERYIVIDAASKLTSEVRLIPAAEPTREQAVVVARRDGVEYSIDDAGSRLLVLHNDNALNFTLATASLAAPSEWRPLIPHRTDTRLMGVDAFADYTVVSFRREGLTGVRVLPNDGEPWEVEFPEPLYDAGPSATPEFASNVLRLSYTSLVTPHSVYDCDLQTGALTLLKREPVLGGYDPAAYQQVREWAVASDGQRIPISIVAPVGTKLDGTNPCLIYGYGAYEASMDPWFGVPRLSLLDRGFVFAVAHVRGGGELGRAWYDDGKLLAKRNTFTDFIACADRLMETGWTSADRLVARGGSAGGLLMGAVANLAPDRFVGVAAEVPFVDPLNSMLDPTLPLTVTEWEEWGNPLEDPAVYAYMKSYAPYENIAPQRYPALLAVTGLHDTRVLFHEPAKWVARLRAVAPHADVLLKTELEAGHGGPSGRYRGWQEQAFVLAWIIDKATQA